jgi:hypothetical protein
MRMSGTDLRGIWRHLHHPSSSGGLAPDGLYI